jgi:hypothetical protein
MNDTHAVRPHTTGPKVELAPASPYSAHRTTSHVFYTVLGWMNAIQYGAHVVSLTPVTFRRNYEVLDCGHKFTASRPPRINCTVCWNAFFEASPEKVAFLKVGLDTGYGSEIRARYGDKFMNNLVRKIAEDEAESVNLGIFSVAEQIVASSVHPSEVA